MKTNDIIWLVSQISAFTGECLGTTQGELYVWDIKDGEIVLDAKKKEIGFVDCGDMDTKTYYSIVGLAVSNGLTTEDYFYSTWGKIKNPL